MAPSHPLPALRLTEPAIIILGSLEKDSRSLVVCLDLSGDAGNGISCTIQTALLGWRWCYLFCTVVSRILMPCDLLRVIHLRSIFMFIRKSSLISTKTPATPHITILRERKRMEGFRIIYFRHPQLLDTNGHCAMSTLPLLEAESIACAFINHGQPYAPVTPNRRKRPSGYVGNQTNEDCNRITGVIV